MGQSTASKQAVHADSPSGTGAANRANVLGCEIDRLDMDQTVRACERAVLRREPVQHVAINAAKLVAMRSDAELRDIVANCELVSADGQAVVWASHLVGDPLPCRVAGIDLMYRLFESAEELGFSIYILGAKAATLKAAVSRIRQRHPKLNIAGYRDGYFAESESKAVAEAIAAANPDMLFVAISSPRKERFLGSHRNLLDTPFIMGVGGSIDIVAGATTRAPEIMQRIGLEWLYRLLQEPRRMFRRYMSTNMTFVGLTLLRAAQVRLGLPKQ